MHFRQQRKSQVSTTTKTHQVHLPHAPLLVNPPPHGPDQLLVPSDRNEPIFSELEPHSSLETSSLSFYRAEPVQQNNLPWKKVIYLKPQLTLHYLKKIGSGTKNIFVYKNNDTPSQNRAWQNPIEPEPSTETSLARFHHYSTVVPLRRVRLGLRRRGVVVVRQLHQALEEAGGVEATAFGGLQGQHVQADARVVLRRKRFF